MKKAETKRSSLVDVLIHSLTLRRLEWVGITAPLAFLLVYTWAVLGPAQKLLTSAGGVVVLVVLLGAAITVFTRLMFHAIAQLQRNIEELSRLTARQNAELRALNEANLALSEEKLVSSVLQRVVELSQELVQAKYAALGIGGDDGGIKALYFVGMDEKTVHTLGALPTGRGVLGLMLHRTEPLRLDKISSHPASIGFPAGHPPMNTFLGVPIRYRGETVGSLYLSEKAGGLLFTDEDEEIVRLFANQAAVAIHNARLYEQLQALAVETERSRISREMHDGLAQVLSYVNTKAQAVEEFLAKGDVDVAQGQVRELSQAARKVYRDIREGILALRTQLGPDRRLQDVLAEYLNEYELQFRQPVKVQWGVRPDEMEISPLQEVQVLRIIQEALTNVRKHAEATDITLSFVPRDNELEIEVKDNGKGFNPLAIRRGEWPHLGLQTMQERAEAIGGSFEVDSAPGRGTVVRVRLPRVIHPRASQSAP